MPKSQKKRLSAVLALVPKHVTRAKKQPVQLPLPTMQQSVTDSDIELWCEIVTPNISASRRAAYVKNYNVPAKIVAAKIAGKWPPVPTQNIFNLTAHR